MTKNRARKRATRQRAALTGERYVVAQRAIDLPPHRTGRMHELLHRIPGVPAHIEGGLQSTSRRLHLSRRHNEPRVLVGWQNWIASRFRVKGGRSSTLRE